MKKERKVILYIATSLDGYIAKPGDNLDFLSMVEKEGEDYGYADFEKSVDTVIMGRKTFDWVMKETSQVPYPDKDSYVATRTPRPAIGKTRFYTGDLKELILRLKNSPGMNIFCVGGAEIVSELQQAGLIDEFIISVVPVLVGNGTRLFRDGSTEQELALVGSTRFETGLVQLHYRKIQR